MSKKVDKVKLAIISFIIILAFILITFLFWWNSDNSEVSARCAINNIELINVSPNNCWNKDFVSDYCPVPKDIDCSFGVKGIGAFAKEIIKQMN